MDGYCFNIWGAELTSLLRCNLFAKSLHVLGTIPLPLGEAVIWTGGGV